MEQKIQLITKNQDELQSHLQSIESQIQRITDISFKIYDLLLEDKKQNRQFYQQFGQMISHSQYLTKLKEIDTTLKETQLLKEDLEKDINGQQTEVLEAKRLQLSQSVPKNEDSSQQKISAEIQDDSKCKSLDKQGEAHEELKGNIWEKEMMQQQQHLGHSQEQEKTGRKSVLNQQTPQMQKEIELYDQLLLACKNLENKSKILQEKPSAIMQQKLLQFVDILNDQISKSEIPFDQKQILWTMLQNIITSLK